MLATASILALVASVTAQGLETIQPFKGPFNEIPILGLGTFQVTLNAQNASETVAAAIHAGYRHIDTAAIYGNQKLLAPGIQEGLKRAGIRREDLWVTSKLWNDRHTKCEQGLKETLAELNLEYLDLYLMHFPVGSGRKFDHVETWKCMETLVRTSGPRTRFIGISNFSPKQLDELLASKLTIKPKVHQMELHPYLQQNDWVARHKKEGITVVGYAPLGNTSPVYRTLDTASSPMPLLTNPVIMEIAKEHGCTPAQVVLAWNMRRGVGVIPKSVHVDRQKENFHAQGKCLLTDEDDLKIKGMEKTWVGRYNNPCTMMRMDCFQGLQADPKRGYNKPAKKLVRIFRE